MSESIALVVWRDSSNERLTKGEVLGMLFKSDIESAEDLIKKENDIISLKLTFSDSTYYTLSREEMSAKEAFELAEELLQLLSEKDSTKLFKAAWKRVEDRK